MDIFLSISVEVLRLVPLVLAFYIPALMGVVILRERGEAFKLKAGLLFAGGFGVIVLTQLLLRSVSAAQVAGTLALSALQIALALLCAYITVYRLAD